MKDKINEEITNIETDIKKELDMANEDMKTMDGQEIIKAEKEKKKKIEEKVVEIIEGCKLYRGVFIQKKELIKKLEEAFPEK